MSILSIHQEIESIVPENATTLANVRWWALMNLKNEIASKQNELELIENQITKLKEILQENK